MLYSLQPHRLYVTCQAPLSMEFSRQEYWSRLPFLCPEDLPNPGIKPGSPTLQADSLSSETLWKPYFKIIPPEICLKVRILCWLRTQSARYVNFCRRLYICQRNSINICFLLIKNRNLLPIDFLKKILATKCTTRKSHFLSDVTHLTLCSLFIRFRLLLLNFISKLDVSEDLEIFTMVDSQQHPPNLSSCFLFNSQILAYLSR